MVVESFALLGGGGGGGGRGNMVNYSQCISGQLWGPKKIPKMGFTATFFCFNCGVRPLLNVL